MVELYCEVTIGYNPRRTGRLSGTATASVAGGSLHQFGVSCTQAHRLRLEMEGSAGGLFYKTYEIELLTPGNSESSCACRHGGACLFCSVQSVCCS